MDPRAPLTEDEAAEFAVRFRALADSVNGFIQGKASVVDLALTCLLAEGHLLVEDVPGVGKTSLARSIAGSLGASWQRIQFTPDLLPSDVTGVSVYHQGTGEFAFHPGPVFAHVVLADEINRASPRTQSALLEVMEERTVTVDGAPNNVPRPFIVIATQNPVEMDGTYPLPEAQLDRFMMKTSLGYPDRSAETAVLAQHHAGRKVADVSSVSDAEHVATMVATAESVHVAPSVMDYVVRLVSATREHPQVRLGASPRGSVNLLRSTRVRAASLGRPYVVPGDVQELALPVLGHRIVADPAVEARGGGVADVVSEIVEGTPAPQGSFVG
ncbi:MAG: MoxR family ATPase [Candidatus Nanopelagicales bacterium]